MSGADAPAPWSGRRAIAARWWHGSAASAALLIVCAGCGLQVLPSIGRPTDALAQLGSRTFSFHEPESVDPVVFRGYEIYYKFYATGAEGETLLVTLFDLDQHGFVRLAKESETSSNILKPLIPVLPISERTNPHTVTLHFNLSSGEPRVEAQLDLDGSGNADLATEQLELRRGVAGDLGAFELFTDCAAYESGDDDAAEVLAQLQADCATGTEVQLQVYALAFGKDGLTTDVHSSALFLGSIELEFPL